MTILDKIQGLNPNEVRELIKENLDKDEFLAEVENHKEQLFPLLLKNKILPEKLVKDFIKTSQEKSWLLDLQLQNNYTPYPNQIEEVLDEGNDEALVKIIEGFPSYPWTVQYLMKMINKELVLSASRLLKRKNEFQKLEIIILMFKTGFESQDLIDVALSRDEVLKQVLEDIQEEEASIYPKVLISKAICSVESLEEYFDPSKALSLKDKLDINALEKVLELYNNKNSNNNSSGYGGYYGRRRKRRLRHSTRNHHGPTVEWAQELETLDTHLLRDFLVKNAPEHSKFRLSFLETAPAKATDAELMDNYNNKTMSLKYLAAEFLSRDISLLKRINLEFIEQYLSPTDVVESIANDTETHEKKVYLYNQLSAKYRPALLKSIPSEYSPKVDTSRKKSYFLEAFDALKKRSIENFREALSHGYTLDKFVEDTKQSSKSTSCENLTLDDEIIVKFSKQELFKLINTPIRFQRRWGYSDDENKLILPYQCSVEEAITLLDKFSVGFCFDSSDNKTKFIEHSAIDEEKLSDLASEKEKEIFENADLLKVYIKKSKSSKEVKVSPEILEKLAKVLTAQELRKTATVDYSLESCLHIKGSDGEFFVTQEQINEMLSSRYSIENSSLIESLIKRDPEFSKKLVKAYLGGNKALSELFGDKINIKRQKLEYFKKLDKELSLSVEAIVDEIFSSDNRLEAFHQKLLNPTTALQGFAKGREVIVDEISSRNLEELGEIPQAKFLVKKLVLRKANSWGSDGEVLKPIPANVSVKALFIESGLTTKESFESVERAVSEHSLPVTISEQVPVADKLFLVKMNSSWVNHNDVIAEFLLADNFVSECSIDDFKFLENHGLLIDDTFVYKVLEHHLKEKDIISWIASRVGSLENYVVGESDTTYLEPEYILWLKSTKLNIVDDDKLKLMEIENQLLAQGVNFEPIDVEDFSLKDISYLIKFIETKVDPNYIKLNLVSSNIDTIKVLSSYSTMKNIYSLDDEDVVRLLLVPQNMLSNKKALKGLRDLITVAGGGFSYKVESLKRAVEIINPKVELNLADFVNYEDLANVKESETFVQISLSVLRQVEAQASEIKVQKIFLKEQKKASVFRFLRTCSQKGDNYMRDILEMINSVVNGANALEERVSQLIAEAPEENEQNIKNLTESIEGLRVRLAEISVMDEAEHMHDRLVPLLSFIKSDPVQPLGQDKYVKFEKSKEVEGELGYKLYFPKTRGDLQYLGDANGWCVNYHKSYGDNVISKGNILVGLCEKGKESTKENVIALAHYLKKGPDNYYLEQLKWSSKKQNGSRNVDATASFKHSLILQLIKDYLHDYEKKKGIK